MKLKVTDPNFDSRKMGKKDKKNREERQLARQEKAELAKAGSNSLGALAELVKDVDTDAALQAARDRRASDRVDVEGDLSRPRINLKNVMMSVGVRSFTAIIIAHNRNNGFWGPDNPKPKPGQRPVCFSIDGKIGKGNNAISEGTHDCRTCPQNQFGSGKDGKGKACKNTRLLMIHRLAPREQGTAAIEIVQIAPTALAATARYLQEFLDDDEDFFAFQTTFTAVFDPKSGEATGWEFTRGEALPEQMVKVAAALNLKHHDELQSAKDLFEGSVDNDEAEEVD